MKKFYRSPYAFVPLSEHIYFPDWADQVTQDIPFSDGIDGEFDITVTAMSPVFIRNGATQKEARDTSFFKQGDDYYIPATSIKGMVRSVLEIASYGKMQHIADKRYAIRDLQLPAYRSWLSNSDLSTKVKAGWLDISDDQDWKIYPCEFALFKRREINNNFGNRRMSAAQKYYDYLKLGAKSFTRKAKINYLSKATDETYTGIPQWEASFCENGDKTGTLVFTGQPQEFIEGKTRQKQREFFFYDVQDQPFSVDEKETVFEDEYGVTHYPNRDDFIFIHAEQSASGDLDSWIKGSGKYSLKEIRNKYFGGRIPVFYVKEKGIFRFGLAMMFRFAGCVTTADAVRNVNREHYPERGEKFTPDLADLIFGYTNGREGALKGRVQFSACKAKLPDGCENQACVGCDWSDCPYYATCNGRRDSNLPLQCLILGAPKPSFYPAYLQQPENLNDKNQYSTFLDNHAKLRGWKRYPAIGKQEFTVPDRVDMMTTKMKVCFRPLPEQTIFTGKVRFHNLRPIELGALLWALELHNSKYYCHTLGMAKPYGYGRVKVVCNGKLLELLGEEKVKQMKQSFQTEIEKAVQPNGEDHKFTELSQIKALLNMARYPVFNDHGEKKENIEINWDFSYLGSPQRYSKLKGNMQRNEPSCVLADYPSPRIFPLTTAEPVANQKITPEDFFCANLPNRIKDATKQIKKLGILSEEQIECIHHKYGSRLTNKYSQEAREFLAELKKHWAPTGP